ncbi:MAG: hypothetical protein P9M11_07035 [Candidatus Tenebribacter burtonii]|jgi:hypothetical protein|nr:hypothetical protein [Candidatus Tenebribacter burtonii]
MIKDKCFDLKWIKEIQKKNERLNPVFIENTIYAFELFSELIKLYNSERLSEISTDNSDKIKPIEFIRGEILK